MGSMKRFLIAIAVTVYASSANAVILTFTDEASFLGALTGPVDTLDFEGLTAGDTISSGATVDGITFTYDYGGVEMEVRDEFLTTSPINYLGTNDAGVFQDGDDFSLSFAPVNAIGLSFITADSMLDNDITLFAGGASVGLDLLSAGADLGDTGIPFFLGIIDTENRFTMADIVADGGPGGPYFLYNVDDIITSVVPLPGAAWLFLSGLVGLFAARKRSS